MKPIGCIFILPIITVTMACSLAAAGEPRVAVLVEEAFPNFGGTQSIPPPKMVERFAGYGIAARGLSATELAKADAFNAARYTVLVMPYGNAFPATAFENFQQFHRAGGCLVTTGIPFTQPKTKTDNKWVPAKGQAFWSHAPDGIGIGGYGGPDEGSLLVLSPGFQPNPLGLKDEMLPSPSAKMQWLDPLTLSTKDEVIPLVGLLVPGEKEPHPLSAIIRHRCDEFHGAIDVWLGTVASRMDEADAYCANQMLVRCVAWCLREKGQMPAAEARTTFAALDREGKPNALPGDLAYWVTTRPWGDTYLPKSCPPARRLQLVDVSRLKPAERIALACLQGLTSRKQPCIWLSASDHDRFWLDWHVAKHHVDGYDLVADWKTLFKQHAAAVQGAVIPDPALYRSDLLAANVAACEDLIIATPELARELDLPMKVDLRGRFRGYADGLEWLWANYRDRLNHHLSDFVHPSWLATGAFAYSLQWRAPMLWIAGPIDAAEPGADMFREKRTVGQIFAQLATNTPVIGFPGASEGVGAGEVNGVSLASRYAHPLVCTNYLANACVTSGVVVERLQQPRQAPAPALERDKIYIALNVSDGDNQNCWLAFSKDCYFDRKRFGEFPLAFGMGPPILDLQPGRAQWYFEHANGNIEFIADVSGVGYMHPDRFGTAYTQPQAVFDGFLDWTRRYMDRLGMRTVRPVHGEDDVLARYALRIPEMHSIFADMGRYSGRSGIANLTYLLPSGMPVFRSVTSWRYGKEGMLREIREQVGSTRPALVNAFVHCWTFNNLETLAAIYDARDKDMVFVTPTQLAELFRRGQNTQQ